MTQFLNDVQIYVCSVFHAVRNLPATNALFIVVASGY